MDYFKFVGVARPGSTTALKKQIEFTTQEGPEFYGIRYYDVSSTVLESLYALLPEEVHQDFYSSLLVINHDVPPHTDIVETAGLNCYTEPGGYWTNFYVNENNARGIEYADHGEGHIYDPQLLTRVGAFQAQPFEIYLIDNKAIHQVVTYSFDKPRREVLQLATNKYSFEEVCKMIKGYQ